MAELALDVESTTWNKGNPYDSRNKLVCYSWATDHSHNAQLWPAQTEVQTSINESSLIVGFNFKFDYHWLAKEGVDLTKSKIWDVQIAEFILSNQTNRFPSLDQTCEKYGIAKKLDVVKTEYWDKGINTDAIPWDVLREYAAHDAAITLQCYHAQLKSMTPAQVMLCKLMCQDLHILREMEANGLPYDEELCQQRSMEVDDQISKIKHELAAIYPHIPLNFGSNDHLSAFLYGGVVKEEAKEHVGFYKGGQKAGQPKYKNVIVEHQLPRLYTPLKGSELLKEGMFATDEGTLRKLKGKQKVINLLLELAKLEKRNGTYYKGLVKLREEMHWPKGKLHGQFNQCVAATGRLSSSKPNLQNFDSQLQDIFISEYRD
jgi:DNA polymerase I-like protein with 3'-5' exonuclease and polymerase domains